ncbi:IS1380 family transposase [Candidatus Latescibacterota bacterium]
MRPIDFVISQTDESLTTHSGLALVGQMLKRSKLSQRLDAIPLEGRPRPEISHGEVATAMVGLLCLGKPDFEAIEAFRDDPFFGYALGLHTVPSAATVPQRLNQLRDLCGAVIREESADLIARHAPTVSPCWQVDDGRCGDWVALDLDVSPFDNSNTKKEGVSRTYKKVDGYAPIFAYLGQEGYLLNCELREGKQHSEKGFPAFLKQTLKLGRVTDQELLVRLDAAHDDIETLRICKSTPKVDYLMARNRRNETTQQWLQEAQQLGTCERPREGKEVYRGDTLWDRDDHTGRVVFEVIRRTISKKGQALLIPEVEVHTWWTSLEAEPDDVIELYHQHGTSEQFHSELKTDMDLERLPSGKFGTNALVLWLGMMAYNLLRLCGQTALKQDRHLPPEQRAPLRRQASRRRLRSVILDLMYQAARLVYHGRRWGWSFARHNRWFAVWHQVHATLAGA